MKIEELEPSMIDLTSTICVFGKRGSGKTQLICNLIYDIHKNKAKKNQQIDLICCFSPTDALQSNFSRFIPQCFIHSSYNENILLKLLETQKELKIRNGRTSNVVVILDDFGYDKSIWNSTLNQIFCNSRHYNICFIVTFQYSMQLPPSLRANIDIVISMKEPVLNNRKKLYQSLYGILGSWQNFEKTFKEVTEDWGAIVCINNGSSSNEIEKNVFWYRSNPEQVPKEFRVGRSVYWKWNDEYRLNQRTRLNAQRSIVQVRKEEDNRRQDRASGYRDRNSHSNIPRQVHDQRSPESEPKKKIVAPLSLIL